MATEFSSFKYQHGDGASRSRARRWFTALSLGLALLLIAAPPVPLPLGLLALLVPLVAWASARRELLLGPRYLLCGKTIVYYANVQCLVHSCSGGTLQVQSGRGTVFVLERAKFPTNARKADKIAKNKAAKFDKVVAKITEKVQKARPGVELREL